MMRFLSTIVAALLVFPVSATAEAPTGCKKSYKAFSERFEHKLLKSCPRHMARSEEYGGLGLFCVVSGSVVKDPQTGLPARELVTVLSFFEGGDQCNLDVTFFDANAVLDR